jgi:hypothetical protein
MELDFKIGLTPIELEGIRPQLSGDGPEKEQVAQLMANTLYTNIQYWIMQEKLAKGFIVAEVHDAEVQ